MKLATNNHALPATLNIQSTLKTALLKPSEECGGLGTGTSCLLGPFSAPNSLVPWGGQHLSGRVLPGPLEQNELWQLLGTWEGAAPGWNQPAMDTDLLAGSPAWLHYHCGLNTNM